MKTMLLVATATGALCLASPAFADTYLMTDYSVYGSTVQLLTPDNVYADAGRITFSGPAPDIEVWCMDVVDLLFKPYLFDINPATLLNLPKPGIPATFGAPELQTVKNLVYLGNDAIDNHGASNVASAEYQVAIWQAEYGGAFTYSASSSFTNAVNGLITAADGGSALYGSDVGFLWLSDVTNAPNQTMIEQVDTGRMGGVPETQTWAMLGIGFALLSLLGVHRSREGRFTL